MIELRNIRKSYRTEFTHLEVLKGIDLAIEKGELVSIMGPSGSGKSTLLNILGLLDNYDSGEYYLDSHLIKDISEAQAVNYRKNLIGFVFQSLNLLSFKNAAENVAIPLNQEEMDRNKRMEVAIDYLDRVGLKDWAFHLPNQMSGSQLQRVAIARALAAQPKIILADEPTGALDSRASYEVMEIFEQINREGMTVVIVTHDNDIAARTSRIIRLNNGLIE